jgi:hypothetical protein
LAGCTSYCANRKALWSRFRVAVVALCFALFYHLHLPIEASCSALNKWNIRCKTHSIDMSSRVQIVKGIENDRVFLEEFNIVLRILDVSVIGFEFNVRVELCSSLFCNLLCISMTITSPSSLLIRTKALDFLICSCRNKNCRLRLLRSIVSRSIM